MQQPETCDVLVIGGGPAGSFFGYLLLVYTLSGEARLGALLVAGVVLLRGLQILAGRW